MIAIVLVLLVAAFLLRHPALSSALGLLALLLILGALVGAVWVVVAIAAAVLLALTLGRLSF